MGEGELPLADGPLVLVELPDGQNLYVVVRGRCKEADGTWWYDVRTHIPSQEQRMGKLAAVPAPVDFRVPAALCTPVDGQAYDTVPTERHGITPEWKIEHPVYVGAEQGPVRIVHRGYCASARDHAPAATADQARTTLRHPDTAPCPICRPDRPLHANTTQ